MEKKYELLYIVPTRYTDDEVAGIRKQVTGTIEKVGGKVTREESLAKIKLAYPIAKQRHGTYVLVHFTAETSALQELDRQLGLTDEVIRHTVLVLPKGAEEKTFELTSYVAPLSEEARDTRSDSRGPRREGSAPAIPGTAPAAVVARTEASMSIEELDKKLDQILEGDVKA